MDALQTAGAWLSRLLSTTILAYIGYKIVEAYSFVMDTVANKAINGECHNGTINPLV